MSIVCESLQADEKLVHVDVSGLSWLHLRVNCFDFIFNCGDYGFID